MKCNAAPVLAHDVIVFIIKLKNITKKLLKILLVLNTLLVYRKVGPSISSFPLFIRAREEGEEKESTKKYIQYEEAM
jgi:hypothetical protein